jgi:colicin import membrane protein
MHASADRLDFAPPPQPGTIRAFALAILAHVLLMLALTWGINWNSDSQDLAAEAELWSSVPQQAAPKVVQAPPLPVPQPAPPPPPVAKVEPPPAPPPPVSKAPDIALEREKQRREQAERRQEELERQKKLAERKKQEELKRQEVAEKKAAEEEEKKKKKAEELAKAKAKQEEAKLAALRKENLERMMKGAAGTGAPSSTGTAVRSAGPSSSYAGRIAAKIKPNIVFTDVVSGNPAALVEIRVAPDGTIVGRKLLESSGNTSWDQAVLRAIDRTEVIPRDTDGRVVPQFPIEFRPKS